MSCGIVVALPEELATLTSRKLAQGECLRLCDDTLVAYAGAGPHNAANAANLLIAKGANRLISWGCAAALAPQLRPGQLVIADRIFFDQQIYEADKFWSDKVSSRLGEKLAVGHGKLVTETRIVALSEDKQAIHSNTGAVALDMESGAIAKVASQSNLPCLVLRAIADPVTLDLPPAVSRAMNEQGQVELGKLLRHLALHPWEVPALVKLGLHFHAAQKTLKTIARHLNEIAIY
ncbi:phosphorylase [Methylomonas sp. HW2-6]|uniref:phosphorylase family protein n=1 Tax=Methylomonas sp. HW2-6 TaxID=3376687 RepID=UPI0040412C61